MRKICLLAAFALLLSGAAMAQDQPKAEAFAGYSFARINPGSGLNGFNLNGWHASVAGNFNNWFGIVGDFTGHYGKPDIGGIKVDTKVHTYTFGPRLSYRKNEKVTPFAHALFGGINVKGSAAGAGISENGFAMALGGGVDARVNDRIAIRVAQFDYLMTRIQKENQHNFRYSAGIVFRFK